MYKLYDYDVHTLIDKSEDEYDIITTMSTYFHGRFGTRFLIIHYDREQDMDEIYKSIKTRDEYLQYIKEYKTKKLKQMSCMELKKEIIDIKSKHKIKRKCK